MAIQHISYLLRRKSAQPSCSMGYKYTWCNDLIANLKDKDGNSLCIFHAPKGEKGGVSLEEFNTLVFERMNPADKKDRLCDLSGTIFDGPISFTAFFSENPNCSFTFQDVVFSGDVDFTDVDFIEAVDFSNAHFCSRADFVRAHFRKTAPFNGAIFDEESFFSDTIFSSKAHFFDTTFLKMSHFTRTTFYQELYLSIGCFKKGADFNDAKYYKRIVFKRPVEGVPK